MIEAIRERLAERIDDIDVQGALALSAAQAAHQRDAIYVVPLGENANPDSLVNAVRQTVDVTIGIILAITNRRDRRGEAAEDEVTERRRQVRAAILGFEPAGGDPLTYLRGRLLRLADQTVWWQDEYATVELISAMP